MGQNLTSKFNILNSIKFRLLLFFSIILIISTTTTLILINYSVRSYLAPTDVNEIRGGPAGMVGMMKNLRQLSDNVEYRYNNAEAKELIRLELAQDRQDLQERIMLASFLMIVAQILIATAGGYMVISKVFGPIEKLNKLMKEINEKALDVEIKDEDAASEMKELITSFNSMVSRLQFAFSSQKQFVENVSHEIKTPLTVIKTNLEMLLIDKTAGKNEIESAIRTSVDSINYLNKLTEDLLLISLVDRQNLKLERIELNKIVEESAKEAQDFASTKNIKVNLNGNNSAKIFIKGLDVLLKRSISNLIENAIRYSDANSSIEVGLALVEGNMVKLMVADNGVGIDDEHKNKVFDRFYRVDKSRSRHTGGTGLGLAITKEIVQMCGGKISMIDNIPKGTIVAITLPMDKS